MAPSSLVVFEMGPPKMFKCCSQVLLEDKLWRPRASFESCKCPMCIRSNICSSLDTNLKSVSIRAIRTPPEEIGGVKTALCWGGAERVVSEENKSQYIAARNVGVQCSRGFLAIQANQRVILGIPAECWLRGCVSACADAEVRLLIESEAPRLCISKTLRRSCAIIGCWVASGLRQAQPEGLVCRT